MHQHTYYIDVCVRYAIEAKMQDALLTAIDSIGNVLSKVTRDVDTDVVEHCLIRIASKGYALPDSVCVLPAVEMLMVAAQKDLRVRGHEPPTILSRVLKQIVPILPYEVLMERAGQRTLQTIAPYSITSSSNIPTLLEEAAQRIEPVDRERPWIDPFGEFSEISEQVVGHYREVASQVDFQGVLLEKWVVDSLVASIKVHVQLLKSAPDESHAFLETIADRALAMIWAAPAFFHNKKPFPKQHVEEACEGLAVLGIIAMQGPRPEIAITCGQAIHQIAVQFSESETREPYLLADIFITLEVLVRAADALNFPTYAEALRSNIAKPAAISDDDWPHYAKALKTRSKQLEERLHRDGRRISLEHDAAAMLRRLLGRH